MTSEAEHAVLIHMRADAQTLYLDDFEDPIAEAIHRAGVGEFDGNEIGSDDAVLYMYGPDADALFDVVSGVISTLALPAGCFAIKRYGPPGSRETRIALD